MKTKVYVVRDAEKIIGVYPTLEMAMNSSPHWFQTDMNRPVWIRQLWQRIDEEEVKEP